MNELKQSHTVMVSDYLKSVADKVASNYMLTIARDGEQPVRSIYYYNDALEAASAFERYSDWGFAKEYLTVTLYEPTGKTHVKSLHRPKGGECVFVKADYVEATSLLQAVKPFTSTDGYNNLVLGFAKLFSKDNQRFDLNRFLQSTDYTGDPLNVD